MSHPQGGYQQQPQQGGRAGAAPAMIAGFLGLAATALLGVSAFKLLDDLLQPVLLSSAIRSATGSSDSAPSFGEFFKQLYEFDNVQSSCLAIALIVAPFLLIFSVLPATSTWLRGSTRQGQGSSSHM